jgi:hypothetical protein
LVKKYLTKLIISILIYVDETWFSVGEHENFRRNSCKEEVKKMVMKKKAAPKKTVKKAAPKKAAAKKAAPK